MAAFVSSSELEVNISDDGGHNGTQEARADVSHWDQDAIIGVTRIGVWLR